jgi:NarL family two-component system response regulator LiaR
MTCQLKNAISIYVTEEQKIHQQIYQASFESSYEFKFLFSSFKEKTQILSEVLEEKRPDILVMGVRHFNTDLYQIIEQVRSRNSQVKIILLIASIANKDAGFLHKLLQRCHNGFAVYLKQSLRNTKQLHDIIHSVNLGQIILDPVVASSIMRGKTENPFARDFTDREFKILKLLSQGFTNQGIAQDLCIDIKTVACHLNNIYSKLKNDRGLNIKYPR